MYFILLIVFGFMWNHYYCNNFMNDSLKQLLKQLVFYFILHSVIFSKQTENKKKSFVPWHKLARKNNKNDTLFTAFFHYIIVEKKEKKIVMSTISLYIIYISMYLYYLI